jgi:uncharacterized surface protein with fasciclin (FAS1) repeats
MKIISKISKIVPILLAVLVLTASCNNDDDNTTTPPMEGNIVEVALTDPQLTSLVTALQITGLTSVLEQDGPFTVLAPTNAAFTAFLNGTPIENVPVDALSAILLNHVISGDFEAEDLIGFGEGYVPSSSPNAQGLNVSIYFNTSNGVRFNGTASVTSDGANISASNGVIHKIDRVLDLPDIADHAIANPNLTSLVTALGEAGLVGAVQGPGPLTVLAPDNAAFATFLDGADPADVPVDVLTNILLNHVLAGSITSTMLTDMGEGYTTTLAQNADADALSLYFNTSEGVSFNGISGVTNADIVATNGVIHTVNAVIGLPTIATFATSNPALSGLVAAVLRADEGDNVINWLPAISNPDLLFTVFAPADPAFDVLLTDLGVSGLDQVDPAAVNGLLTLHVVNNANVRSTDLGDLGGVIPTIGGNLSLDGVVITDGDGNTINILAPSLVDIQAINGVVHAVDYVIRSAVE